eukprot:g28213.t1
MSPGGYLGLFDFVSPRILLFELISLFEDIFAAFNVSANINTRFLVLAFYSFGLGSAYELLQACLYMYFAGWTNLALAVFAATFFVQICILFALRKWPEEETGVKGVSTLMSCMQSAFGNLGVVLVVFIYSPDSPFLSLYFDVFSAWLLWHATLMNGTVTPSMSKITLQEAEKLRQQKGENGAALAGASVAAAVPSSIKLAWLIGSLGGITPTVLSIWWHYNAERLGFQETKAERAAYIFFCVMSPLVLGMLGCFSLGLLGNLVYVLVTRCGRAAPLLSYTVQEKQLQDETTEVAELSKPAIEIGEKMGNSNPAEDGKDKEEGDRDTEKGDVTEKNQAQEGETGGDVENGTEAEAAG